MAKICPLTKDKVLYLDCLECDEKICKKTGGKKSGKKEQKEKEKK